MAPGGSGPWRLALFPTVAMLGIALPISFASRVDQYLYYLRPVELIPAYGTALLLLGAPLLSVSLMLGVALVHLHSIPARSGVRAAIEFISLTLAAMVILAALTNGFVDWVKTFGQVIPLRRVNELTATSMAAAGFVVVTARGRLALLRLHSIGTALACAGAISLVSLPFFGWDGEASALAAAQSQTAARKDIYPPTLLPVRPNFLLVTIDALAAEHMSVYGSPRPTTPALEAFAHSATTFDRAYANANFTTPGVTSIMTSTRPWTHRALQLPAWPIGDVRRESLPAVLSRAGYDTGYIATNPWAAPARNGLGTYFEFHGSDRAPAPSACQDQLAAWLPYACAATVLPPFIFPVTVWTRVKPLLSGDSPNGEYDPRAAIQSAVAWLQSRRQNEPLFLWVHLLPPHSPYAVPEPWLGRFSASPEARTAADSHPLDGFLSRLSTPERQSLLAARYDESVLYVDHYVGELLSRTLPLLGKNTAVIISADHGESFRHDYGLHSGPALYDELIHIPLLIRLPLQSEATRTSALVEQIDIAPTIAELAGLPQPSRWEGRSLVRLIQSPDNIPPPDRPAFAMNFEENPRRSALTTGSVAVIDGRWKLIHYMGALHYPAMPKLQDELYDLSADPGENSNRTTDQPGEAERLNVLIAAELARHGGAVR